MISNGESLEGSQTVHFSPAKPEGPARVKKEASTDLKLFDLEENTACEEVEQALGVKFQEKPKFIVLTARNRLALLTRPDLREAIGVSFFELMRGDIGQFEAGTAGLYLPEKNLVFLAPEQISTPPEISGLSAEDYKKLEHTVAVHETVHALTNEINPLIMRYVREEFPNQARKFVVAGLLSKVMKVDSSRYEITEAGEEKYQTYIAFSEAVTYWLSYTIAYSDGAVDAIKSSEFHRRYIKESKRDEENVHGEELLHHQNINTAYEGVHGILEGLQRAGYSPIKVFLTMIKFPPERLDDLRHPEQGYVQELLRHM